MLILTFVERDNIFSADGAHNVGDWHVWPALCTWEADEQPDGMPLSTRARARLAQLGMRTRLPAQELWCLAALATRVKHTLIQDGDPDRVEPRLRRVGVVLQLPDLAAYTFFDVLERSQDQRTTMVALGDDGPAKWMNWLANELDVELTP